MYTLRPYQAAAVEATLAHFRKEATPAVVVLPTGAGKSLVIAELARRAKGRVLVLAHVRELVEQNHAKYVSFDLHAGIYSAGLDRKDVSEKVIFGSIQSVARAPEAFFRDFSLLIIDECHRVSVEGDTQYQAVITKLIEANPALKVLGLTATPYRRGFGWIYEYHAPKKLLRAKTPRFFKKCVYELTTRYMIREGYLTPPVRLDAPVAFYDFSGLKLHGVSYIQSEIDRILKDSKRITKTIIANIVDLAKERAGVMIFAGSVSHAQEVMGYLPPFVAALITGETPGEEREAAIEAFKARQLKFLVNVSVLTTGFDAPHVDVIAILRPTESASLYQQIVGRGLRLSEGKKDCLVLDYTGQDHDLFSPVIEEDKPAGNAVLVDVECPQCGTINEFWGIKDADGFVEEHFGRKCQGAIEDPHTGVPEPCGFLFRFKLCHSCGVENDVSAHQCRDCAAVLVDPDKKLKEAMSLKDAHVMRVDSMHFRKDVDRRGGERLAVEYYDADANVLKEYFYLDSPEKREAFRLAFERLHLRVPEGKGGVKSVDEALALAGRYRPPLYLIARKRERYWAIREKIF